MSEFSPGTTRGAEPEIFRPIASTESAKAGATAQWQAELHGISEQLRHTVAPLMHSLRLLRGGSDAAVELPDKTKMFVTEGRPRLRLLISTRHLSKPGI